MFNNELWQKPAGGAGGAGFYTHQIANSVRFNSSATAHMHHTQGTPTNVDKCTISLWVKRGKLGAAIYAFTGSGTSGQYSQISFGGDGNDPDKFFYLQNPGSPTVNLESAAVFRDPSAWHHVVIAQDSTQGTDSNRNKIYINGVIQTNWVSSFTAPFYSTANSDFCMNSSGHKIFVGSAGDSGGGAYLPFDGYIAEYVFIDGTQNDISDFGETKNGVWIPKDPSGLTFGNNGCYLKFESSSDLGNDSSGNNNDFTVSNVSAHDQMTDTPTFNSDSNGGNFATLGPLWKTPDMTFSEGNLKWTCSTNQRGAMSNWSIPLEGKYYFEYVPLSWGNSSGDDMWLGLNVSTVDFTASRGGKATCYGYGANSGKKIDGDNTEDSYGASWGTNDIIGVAVDRVNDTIQFSKNGSFQGSAFAIPATADLFPWVGSGGGSSSASGVFNFGADGTFAGNVTAGGNSDDTGYGNFKYDPPTGFLALCSGNLPVADAVDPAQTDDNYPQKLFSATIWTGNGSGRTISSGSKSDAVWIKRRNGAAAWAVQDSSRGTSAALEFNTNASEDTSFTQGVTAFGSSSFNIGTHSQVNNSSDTYVGYAIGANGGTTSTNSTGTVNATQQVDPSGGFSISTYAGTGSSMTVGHGLSAEPKLTIVKDRGASVNWIVYTKVIDGSLDYFFLNTDAAAGDSGFTGPNSTIWNFDGASSYSNTSGRNYIMYNFANVEGYCKVGKYIGNGDGSDGAFVYTGFKPAWVLVKKTTQNSWRIQDNARDLYNPTYHVLKPQSNAAEDAYTDGTDYNDFLSNGFKLARGGDTANYNANGSTYVYLAMAHNPFKYATAR